MNTKTNRKQTADEAMHTYKVKVTIVSSSSYANREVTQVIHNVNSKSGAIKKLMKHLVQMEIDDGRRIHMESSKQFCSESKDGTHSLYFLLK